MNTKASKFIAHTWEYENGQKIPRDDISLLNEYCEIIGIEIDKDVYKT